MKISTLFYILIQGIRGIFRNKWFSLASIATTAACLFLFGVFYSIVTNFRSMVLDAQQVLCFTVLFDEDATDERIYEIGELLRAREGVREVNYLTAEAAWEYMKQSSGNPEEYAAGFIDNPLADSDSYEVYLDDVALEESIVAWVNTLQGVRKTNTFSDAAQLLDGVNRLISYVSLGIVAILLSVSIFLIRNTVAMGISVRKEEINIMKYIGATDFFVRVPFVLEGMFLGLLGSAVPLGLIRVVYQYVVNFVSERFGFLIEMLNLEFLHVDALFRVLTPVSLCVGVGIGFLGSVTAIRKHLRV
ncbi:MAG: ABC transporter permease [Clostridium sp.]|jgi:cell division transport system permease protein|nr:ABC transporter permease [Clostridium sp.]